MRRRLFFLLQKSTNQRSKKFKSPSLSISLQCTKVTMHFIIYAYYLIPFNTRVLTRAVRRPRRAADNFWAPPPPTFVDWRAAADNLSARRRCHFCCALILLQFSMMGVAPYSLRRLPLFQQRTSDMLYDVESTLTVFQICSTLTVSIYTFQAGSSILGS